MSSVLGYNFDTKMVRSVAAAAAAESLMPVNSSVQVTRVPRP